MFLAVIHVDYYDAVFRTFVYRALRRHFNILAIQNKLRFELKTASKFILPAIVEGILWLGKEL